MWQYFDGVKPPASKKRKLTDDEKRERDRAYDKDKRKRDFQDAWKKDRPWLYWDQENKRMFCEYCRQFPKFVGASCNFVSGCTNVKLCAVKFHEEQKGHTRAVEAVAAKKADSIVGTEAHR